MTVDPLEHRLRQLGQDLERPVPDDISDAHMLAVSRAFGFAPQRRRGRALKVGLVVLGVLAPAASAAAGTGNLPDPAQRVAARVASVVGVELPTPKPKAVTPVDSKDTERNPSGEKSVKPNDGQTRPDKQPKASPPHERDDDDDVKSGQGNKPSTPPGQAKKSDDAHDDSATDSDSDSDDSGDDTPGNGNANGKAKGNQGSNPKSQTKKSDSGTPPGQDD